MVRPHSFEGAIDKLRITLGDAINGVNAAVTLLAGHSKGGGRAEAVNFPVEEALVRETVELLDRWKFLGLSLVKELDLTTAQADLQHRRLYDEKAGLEKPGLLSRRLGHGQVKPETIITGLDAVLDASATLDLLFKRARPALSQSFHDCEMHLEGVIERRQRLDFDIEEVRRQADAVAVKTNDHRRNLSPARVRDLQSEPEATYRELLVEQDRLREKERVLQSGRTAHQRLIDVYEGLAGALNAEIAAVNAMAGKLSVDIEQRIALLKALASEIDSPLPAVARSAPVAQLIEAFEMNVLAGHDLAARKARADSVFTRRLEPHLLPASTDANDVSDEAQPQD